ncbi:unnamed protein product [Acanthosepion pharaonis]|uniref:Uncharacterized protein n=1 Tax=Acanthosepion pharaonis TaxID=158019 RepID=A0A812C1W3_ACAPH|nr:unnamed protein product [Sepia pharaonis]
MTKLNIVQYLIPSGWIALLNHPLSTIISHLSNYLPACLPAYLRTSHRPVSLVLLFLSVCLASCSPFVGWFACQIEINRDVGSRVAVGLRLGGPHSWPIKKILFFFSLSLSVIFHSKFFHSVLHSSLTLPNSALLSPFPSHLSFLIQNSFIPSFTHYWHTHTLYRALSPFHFLSLSLTLYFGCFSFKILSFHLALIFVILSLSLSHTYTQSASLSITLNLLHSNFFHSILHLFYFTFIFVSFRLSHTLSKSLSFSYNRHFSFNILSFHLEYIFVTLSHSLSIIFSLSLLIQHFSFNILSFHRSSSHPLSLSIISLSLSVRHFSFNILSFHLEYIFVTPLTLYRSIFLSLSLSLSSVRHLLFSFNILSFHLEISSSPSLSIDHLSLSLSLSPFSFNILIHRSSHPLSSISLSLSLSLSSVRHFSFNILSFHLEYIFVTLSHSLSIIFSLSLLIRHFSFNILSFDLEYIFVTLSHSLSIISLSLSSKVRHFFIQYSLILLNVRHFHSIFSLIPF